MKMSALPTNICITIVSIIFKQLRNTKDLRCIYKMNDCIVLTIPLTSTDLLLTNIFCNNTKRHKLTLLFELLRPHLYS